MSERNLSAVAPTMGAMISLGTPLANLKCEWCALWAKARRLARRRRISAAERKERTP